MKIYIKKAEGIRGIREAVAEAFSLNAAHLPVSMDARIVLKPNLNANMNALTGNTTDLRLLASVIEFLKERGYRDITVCEGTNSGYYRSNISVISRLKVDELGRHYGVRVKDLNYSQPVYVDFEGGVKAGVAKEVLEADFLINMPKLKTHFEAGMSVCLKNLMGCLVGQENKKKTHLSLAKNILNINKKVRPHLQLVDGLIAMEGLGPTRGTPVKTGFIIAGTDPYLIDLVCSKIAEFDYRKVRTLRAAEAAGLLTKAHHDYANSLDLSGFARKFKEPVANFFASFIHSPKRQKYFLAVRNTAFFTYLCSTRLFGHMLFLTGLRQDNFIKEEMKFEGFTLEKEKCPQGCVRCEEYCPVGLKLPDELANKDNGCIGCQYCFLVCPVNAIGFKGELGFMAEQLRQYDKITRSIA